MKIAIVQFPGSNCERETMLAVRRAGMTPVEFLWNESPVKLNEMDGFILVGGFSYEDRSRAGIIAALDPVMNEIKYQSQQGKPVLGICNGAQILVESGLVPGLKDNQLGMALAENKRIVDGKILGTGFYNAWIHMRSGSNAKQNAFTRHLKLNEVLSVPIAHAEGRFVMPEKLLEEVTQEGLNIFQYCDEAGNVCDNFPVNPNGSMNNIAAVINKAGNVMAIMPHPERTPAGDGIFLSMREYILDGRKTDTSTLSFCPKPISLPSYTKDKASQELIVQLVIADNYALTVENTLRQLGIPVCVSRMVHWQIDCNSLDTLEKIKQTGILYNERKEYLVAGTDILSSSVKAYLVRPKENLLGQEKLQKLEDHFSIEGVKAIQHGILWVFKSEEVEMNDLVKSIISTHIISNPYSQVCYDYE